MNDSSTSPAPAHQPLHGVRVVEIGTSVAAPYASCVLAGPSMERTLSQNEAKVVLDLEWRNQKTVTLAELREPLGASENYARHCQFCNLRLPDREAVHSL